MGLEPLSGQGNTNTAKVIASYAAGIPPDLLHSAYWDKGVYGIRDMVVELEGTFIKADKEYADTMDDFYPHLLESSYWQGKLWSLPQETNSNLPYTNLAYVRGSGPGHAEAGLHLGRLGGVPEEAPAVPRPRYRDWQVGNDRLGAAGLGVHQSAEGEWWRILQRGPDESRLQ